jgi:hypothetical protein
MCNLFVTGTVLNANSAPKTSCCATIAESGSPLDWVQRDCGVALFLVLIYAWMMG